MDVSRLEKLPDSVKSRLLFAVIAELGKLRGNHPSSGSDSMKTSARGQPSPEAIEMKEKIVWLLHNGADADARNASGDTPLMYAAQYKLPDIAKRILDFDVDIHAVPSGAVGEGSTALRWSFLLTDLPMMRLLIEHGARPNKLVSITQQFVVALPKSCTLLAEYGWPVPSEWRDRYGFRNLCTEGKTAYENWQANGCDVSELTPSMLLRFSNIGKFYDAMQPARWRGHEAQLSAILNHITPFLREELLLKQPEFYALLSAPQPVIQGWSAEIDAKEAMQWNR